ncbi:MAG: DUF493 domain-containing protein [Candidatus Competibacteraceae bacterium]|nr:DUF493 domain-containing protein [Candidatus Competibacteraceae bacterium]
MKEETLLEFPCEFPIKAMGRTDSNFPQVVVALVGRHAPDLTEERVRVQASRHGRFQSVTVTVRATSRAQLDAIYQELTDDERVVLAL